MEKIGGEVGGTSMVLPLTLHGGLDKLNLIFYLRRAGTRSVSAWYTGCFCECYGRDCPDFRTLSGGRVDRGAAAGGISGQRDQHGDSHFPADDRRDQAAADPDRIQLSGRQYGSVFCTCSGGDTGIRGCVEGSVVSVSGGGADHNAHRLRGDCLDRAASDAVHKEEGRNTGCLNRYFLPLSLA